MNRPAFSVRAALGLVLVGALIFAMLLWFIAQGDTGPGDENGEAHAQSHGLTGFAALRTMLEKQGYAVSTSRSPGALKREGLLILTPTTFTDADELAEIISERRYTGPTLVILPKWYAIRVPPQTPGARKGWVALGGAGEPGFTNKFDDTERLKMKVSLKRETAEAAQWSGLGMAGALPDPRAVLGLDEGTFASLVTDGSGRDLAGYLDDQGCYPVLDEASGHDAFAECDEGKWNVTFVFEPDLFNNYGMADRNRALLAARIVELAREDQDIPIVFDLTLAGFGATRNLATLAFQPPFLAATLCLALALLVAGWRAFLRFGPPQSEAGVQAFGKRQLVGNAAGFIRRSGRLHLLAAPYAALTARRLAAQFGLRQPDTAAIDAALARRAPDAPPFSILARRLEAARGASDTLRGAHALHALERTPPK